MINFVLLSLVVVILLCPLSSHELPLEQTGTRSSAQPVVQDLWTRRIDTAWLMLKTAPCRKIHYGESCAALRSLKRNDMLLYTATTSKAEGKLATVLVEKVKGKIQGHNAAIVIDPYPAAHFGHTVIVFLVDVSLSKTECTHKGGRLIRVGSHQECLHIGQSESCRNRIGNGRKGRRRCEINFLPLIYEVGDSQLTQRLTCRSRFQMFGPCPPVVSEQNDRCSNSGRCSSQSKFPTYRGFHWLCLEKCDFAVLISGGWNTLMNKPRHLENLKAMWLYLKSKGYLERNMRIFFANNGTVDIDSNRKTRDTVPATESSGILKYIESVCSMGSHCIDTLSIYLNGPTLMNGNLLLWDRNGDGMADGTEMLRVRDLLQKLEYCNASWVNIIADQNYAGHLVESLRRKYAHSDDKSAYRKMSVYASSNKRSYTWSKDFTDAWIKKDNRFVETGSQAVARRLDLVSADVKKELSSKLSFSEFVPPGGNLRTISGKLGEEDGCSLNQPWDISSQLFRFPRGLPQTPEGQDKPGAPVNKEKTDSDTHDLPSKRPT